MGLAPVKRMKKYAQGMAYLKRDILREISVKTDIMCATPATYYVFCTLQCNFRCIFCPQTYGHSTDFNELPREVMLRIIRESKELSGSGYHISVSGGETLTYKPIFEALELAHKLEVDFGITTNGSLLTTENIKRIVGADPFNINISLESVDPAINERMRPTPGATKRVLDAIDGLLAEKERTGARFGIFIKPTVTEMNYRSLPQMVRHFGKNAKVQINPQAFSMIEGGEQFWIKNADEFGAIVDELIALRQEGYFIVPSKEMLHGMIAYFRSSPSPERLVMKKANQQACRIGFRNLFICQDGKAFFCRPLGGIGNILNTSLRDVWFGSEAQQKRHEALRCKIDCQVACRRPISLFTKAKAFLSMS
jgi:MoaA/NifB/PqqE/SkfB family radical SAM enzyme